MGNEQGKEKDKQQIQQVFLNKQQIEILMIKVQGHIELMKNKRTAQVQVKVKELRQMICNNQRNRENEMHKMISLQQDENYVAGCDIVLRYLNILKDRSLLIEQSRGQISQLEELLPFILSICWASSQLSHPSMTEYNQKISGLFGADMFQVAQTSDKVDPELKNMFKIHLSYNPDLFNVMTKFCAVTQIPLEKINEVGHNLSDPNSLQQQNQQQYQQLQPPQQQTQNNNNYQQQQQNDQPLPSTMSYPEQSQQYQQGYLQQQQQQYQNQQQFQQQQQNQQYYPQQQQQFQNQNQNQNQQYQYQQPQQNYQQQQQFQQPQQNYQQPQQNYQQPQQNQIPSQTQQNQNQDFINNQQQQQQQQQPQQSSTTADDIAALEMLNKDDTAQNYVPVVQQDQNQNSYLDNQQSNNQIFNNPYSDQNSFQNQNQDQNQNQNQQYAQIDQNTGNVNFQRGNSFEEPNEQDQEAGVQKEKKDDDMFNNNNNYNDDTFQQQQQQQQQQQNPNQQQYPNFEQSLCVNHDQILNNINDSNKKIQENLQEQQRLSNQAQQTPSQLDMIQQLQKLKDLQDNQNN